MSAWDNLSIRDKAEMMRVAIGNGITNINDIKREYNEFAEGGPTKKYTSKDVERLFWEGNMKEAQEALDQITNTVNKELPEITVFPERRQGEITPVTGNALSRAINNYTGELKYDLANGRVPGGKYTLPAAVLGAAGLTGAASLPAVGEAYYAAGLSPLVMEGLAAPYTAHGLDNLVHGNADWQTALEIAPLAGYAKPMWNAGKETAYNIADRYIFMPHQNSFTRGIGGEAGLQDLIESGLVRGNPVGTETTAKAYGKLTRSNRNNFNDIMRDTGLKDIEHRFYNRTLTEEDFNAIKKAALKYKTENPSLGSQNKITLLRPDVDPLSRYSSYQDYQAKLASDRQTLANATSLDDSGQPLAYFYDNGRNPLTAGHDYAASDYGVRINNASEYNPRIFEGHLHYSMPKAVPLRDPNVEIFGKGPLGLTVKLDKETLQPVWKRDLSNMFRRLETIRTPQITAENAANITPEQWTAAQDAAIAKGDMAEAQRLRDLHFKVNAPNTVIKNVDGTPAHVYHGTFNKGWNSYDKRKFGTSTDNGMYGEGLYATSHRSYADVYARGNNADGKYIGEIKDLYVNGEHPFYVFNKKDLSPKEIVNREDAAYQFGRTLKRQDDIPTPIWEEMNNSDIIIETKGTKRPNFAEIVVPRGEQIKSADAVTYDDNGVRIPLGERDNFNINDIRYALLPTLGIGAAGTLYNQKALGGRLYPDGGGMQSLYPNVGRAIQYFVERGLTDYQAAGLVGNLMRESSMNPSAVNKDSQAYGLAQWLGDRKKNLHGRYGNNPTFDQQLAYIWDELNSTHKNGLKNILASKTAEEAARNAMGYYEFSAGPEAAIRAMNSHGQNGEDAMRKGIMFANDIMGIKTDPIRYNPQDSLPPNFQVPENWELLYKPQYPLDELQATGTFMPAQEVPLEAIMPTGQSKRARALDILSQYEYLSSLLSQ